MKKSVKFSPEVRQRDVRMVAECRGDHPSLCRNIDATADAARLAVVGDPLRVVEYERAAAEAQSFKDAGYVGTVPLSVKSWAEAKGWTAQQAADDILAAAATWYMLLYSIGDARLKAKEAVRSAIDAVTAQAGPTR